MFNERKKPVSMERLIYKRGGIIVKNPWRRERWGDMKSSCGGVRRARKQNISRESKLR